MKIRNGFVSNSSSSSFIIATKGELNRDKLYKVILAAFKVAEDSPIRYVVEQAAKIMANEDEVLTVKQMFDEDYYWGDTQEIEKMVKKGFTSFISGSASNDGEIAESLLCDLNINYEDESIIIKKGGGY